MKRNGLSNKIILVVSERADILQMLEGKIKDGFPKCRIDRVTTTEEACRATLLFRYNLLIVDELNFNKLSHSASSLMQNFPLLVLTDNGHLPPEQKNSLIPGINSHLPSDRSEEIIPNLSRLLNSEFTPGWQRPFKRYGGLFNLGTVEAADKLIKNGMM
jgi:hypothetical protein